MDDLLDLDWSNNATTQQTPKPVPSRTNAGPKDAFADLLSLGSPSNSAPPPTLNQQRLNQNYTQPPASPMARLSSTGTISPSTSPSSSPMITHQPSSAPLAPSPLIPSNTSSSSARSTLDDLLDPFGKSKSKSKGNVPLNTLRSQNGTEAHNPWNFDLMAPGNSTSTDTTTREIQADPTSTVDPFDMDSLMNATKTTVSPPVTTSYMDDDEENPLGLLAEPVPIRKPSPPPFVAEPESPPQPLTSSGTAPTKHDALLAQLVDMGFGVEESQVALDESDNVDLQSAIDIIVQQTEAMRRQQQKQKEDSQSSTPDRSIDSPTSETSFQQQKERLVSQASELGGYFYKNASLLVRSGKQKITKVMEEYKAQEQQQQQQQQQPGRPKWMTEQDVEDIDDGTQNGSMDKFVDSDDDDDDTEKRLMMEQMEQERRHIEALRKKQQQQQRQQQKTVFKSRLLLDDEEEETYVSPSRRRQQQQQQQQPTPKRAPSPSPLQRAPTPPPSRPVVETSSSNLTSASNYRQKGNELFKLGQFADAELEYTRAIDQLPYGHYHLIVLGNNRAMSRLKTGHYKQCIEDCDMVLDLAIATDHKTVQSQGGIEINSRDHTIKALSRKSEALEHLEKYQQALDTYHELIKWEGTGNKKVNQAMARCRQILQPPPKKPVTPRSTTTTNTTTTTTTGKAVSAMRAQAAQQEADDAERLAKTDKVNDQLSKWKQGKEANLRALLATLDTVLWADANWKSIQISELIQPKKCKINYLKAIGKVHPDKLPSNVTVEQRMIASGVFSTLNEAWDSFKTENNL